MTERDEEQHAAFVARALSSPLRLRVLRLCAFDARTNKEIAELLDVNPGTMLHHVRTLVEAGMLEAQPERIGPRGAREVPYRATGLSWRTEVPGQSVVLVETMRQQLQGVDPEDVRVVWMGLRLNAEHRDELDRRLLELVTEFKERGPDPDGEAASLVIVTHPDLNPPAVFKTQGESTRAASEEHESGGSS
jgi:DNA-binding transcriptional ArsR family regulator